VVSVTPRSHLPRERPDSHCTGGWVRFRAGLDGCGKSRPTGIRSPDLATTEASVFFFIWGVPTRAQDLKCAHCHPPRLSRVVGDICWILCSTINSSMCTLYWNKNISTFWINGVFITKSNLAFLLGHPIVCTLLSGILTLSAWSRIIWTRKLTCLFLISVQLEAHSSSWRLTPKLRTTIYPLDFCRCILSIFYYTKVVSSPPPILTFLRPVWLTALQVASNYFVASARGQTETCASSPYQQLFCCLENGSGRIRQQFFCCRNRKVASARALV